MPGYKRKCEDSKNELKRVKVGNVVNQELPKVKVVLLLSYVGRSPFGQKEIKEIWNNSKSRIEQELLAALKSAGLITKQEYDSPRTIDFQVAVSTDKNTSAAINFVFLTLSLEDSSNLLPSKINTHLSPAVRVSEIKILEENDLLRTDCFPTYSYMLPTFALAPTAEEVAEEYRMNENRLQEVNDILEDFVNEFGFHNFSFNGNCITNKSNQANIVSLECTSTFEFCGLQFCLFKIVLETNPDAIVLVSQVVGLAIAVIRNLTSVKNYIMDKKIEILITPKFNIFLEEIHCKDFKNRHKTPDWLKQFSKCNDIIEKFKQEQIYLPIAKAEKEDKVMLLWLSKLHGSYFGKYKPPKLSSKLLQNKSLNAAGNITQTGKSSKLEEKGTSLKETVNTQIPPVILPAKVHHSRPLLPVLDADAGVNLLNQTSQNHGSLGLVTTDSPDKAVHSRQLSKSKQNTDYISESDSTKKATLVSSQSNSRENYPKHDSNISPIQQKIISSEVQHEKVVSLSDFPSQETQSCDSSKLDKKQIAIEYEVNISQSQTQIFPLKPKNNTFSAQSLVDDMQKNLKHDINTLRTRPTLFLSTSQNNSSAISYFGSKPIHLNHYPKLRYHRSPVPLSDSTKTINSSLSSTLEPSRLLISFSDCENEVTHSCQSPKLSAVKENDLGRDFIKHAKNQIELIQIAESDDENEITIVYCKQPSKKPSFKKATSK